MMNKFILYLDESETFNSTGRFFSVGGVIIPDSQTAKVSSDLNLLKASLWNGNSNATSFILHEKEIIAANKNGHCSNPCYNIFRANSKAKALYAGLSKLIKDNSIITIGTCVNMVSLTTKYPGEVNPTLTIALQMLLENYCHFLTAQNAVGSVCYESLQEPGNTPLRQRFFEMQALGTMYYNSHTLQTHISGIDFVDKSDNLPGLQLADFIPNTFARKVAGLTPKHKEFKKAVFAAAYDGQINDRMKYGLKEIP